MRTSKRLLATTKTSFQQAYTIWRLYAGKSHGYGRLLQVEYGDSTLSLIEESASTHMITRNGELTAFYQDVDVNDVLEHLQRLEKENHGPISV